MNNFYCTQGFRNPAVITFPDAASLLLWGDTQTVRELVERHRSGDPEAKKLLPCLIVGRLKAAAPPVRKDENFEDAGIRLLDHDEECDPLAIAKQVTDKLSAAGLSTVLDYSYMEESASGKFHMIAPALSDDVAADIEAYSIFFGLDFDRSVKNTSRLCALTFRTLKGSQLSNLEADNTPARDALLASSAIQVAKCHSEQRDASRAVTSQETGQDDSSNAETYHGIPYTDIIDNIIEEWGGEPSVGDRNNYLYRLTSELATICDCDPDWISQLLADYDWFGLPQEEAMATIRSACKAKKSSGTGRQSRLLRGIIKRLTTVTTDYSTTEGVESSFNPFSEVPPCMPPLSSCPRFVRDLLSRTPSRCYEHVLNTCLPALACYLDGCTCTGIDGSVLKLNSGFLSAGIARMSSGKSSRNQVIKSICKPMKEADALAREAMDRWNDLARRSKASDLPEKPIFASQLLGSDCTSSALISRLKDLPEDKSLLIQCDELQMLSGLQSNTTGTSTPLALLLAFSAEDWTVDRSSEMGVSGSVSVTLNVSAMGTPYQAQRFFAGGYHSGLISRFSFSTIHEDDSEFFYGNYEGFDELMAPYIALLQAEQGKHFSNKKVEIWCRAMQKELLDKAAEYGSESLRNLSYRAIIQCQKKAYIYLIMNKGVWSRKLEDYMTYILRAQIHSLYFILGDLIAKESAAEESASHTPGPQSMLRMLPDTFEKKDVLEVRKRLGMEVSNRAISRQLSAWRGRKLIADNVDGSFTNLKR